MLGLPADIAGCLFDLDGVLTDTARVHDAAWKQVFDEVLRRHGEVRPFEGGRGAGLPGQPRHRAGSGPGG